MCVNYFYCILKQLIFYFHCVRMNVLLNRLQTFCLIHGFGLFRIFFECSLNIQRTVRKLKRTVAIPIGRKWFRMNIRKLLPFVRGHARKYKYLLFVFSSILNTELCCSKKKSSMRLKIRSFCIYLKFYFLINFEWLCFTKKLLFKTLA